MEWYKNKVAWCPICSQGWVQVVRDVETKELFVMCDECESEWNHPEDVKVLEARASVLLQNKPHFCYSAKEAE